MKEGGQHGAQIAILVAFECGRQFITSLDHG
jgi:hypothetical protein